MAYKPYKGRGRRFTTRDEAKVIPQQHKSPCHDCPFKRTSIPGWLGGNTAVAFVGMAHSDARYNCHTLKESADQFWQCAGLATFRENICKLPRDPRVLTVDKQDLKRVFANSAEFITHHGRYD